MANSIKKQQGVKTLFVTTGLILGLIFAAFPIVWMFAMSIRFNNEIFAVPPRLIPQKITLSAYIGVLTNPVRLRFFLNSFIVVISVTILSLLIAIPCAYSFSRFNFKGKKALNIFIISTQTIPPITLLIPFFGLIVSLKLYDTYFALIFTYLVFTLPYAILMMTGYFNTLPKELDEAVLVDGASRFYALWNVLVPVSLPGIVATSIFTFLLGWNEFLFALTLIKSTEMRTIPIGIQQMMGQFSYNWNEMMAMSVLASLPVLLLYLFAQKYFLAGMTAGSVKD